MTTLLLHALAAVGLLILAAVLVRRSTRGPRPPFGHESERFRDPLNASSLALAERIFDPGDYLWLRSEIGFPYLAEDLRHSRRHLALEWLKAMRRSFTDVVGTPDPSPAPSQSSTGPAGRPSEDASSSWQLLWLTLRFHLLMGYALFVVYAFGPYTRLVPSLGWMQTFSESTSPGRRSRLADVGDTF